MSDPLVPTALRRGHAQTVRDSSSNNKLNYILVIMNFLNPEGHQNPISGSKLTAILLKGWNLPNGIILVGQILTYLGSQVCSSNTFVIN